MKPKILLLDDGEEVYKKINAFFEKYDVEFFPRNIEEFRDLSRDLRRFQREEDEEKQDQRYKPIDDIVKNINADIYLIDLDLSGEKELTDTSGKKIKNRIEKFADPLTKKFIISSYHPNVDETISHDGWIVKNGPAGLAKELENSVIKNCNISLKQNQPAVERKKTFFEKFKDKEDAIYPDVSFFIDFVVCYSFYLMLPILCGFATWNIFVSIFMHPVNMFHVAETIFISLLPFLIACAFHIFYKKSLRSYLFRGVRNPTNEDFESSSVLMGLTKKLLVSSLLSYLFINAIEIVVRKEATVQPNYFMDYFDTEDPFMQLYIMGGLIVLLIIFYVSLNTKKH